MNPILRRSSSLLVSALLLVAAPAFAQLTAEQQQCVDIVDKYSRAITKTQSRDNATCVKTKGKGTLVGTMASCLSADLKGKVTRAKEMLLLEESAACTFPPPPFGYQRGDSLGGRLAMHERDLLVQMFGDSLDTALVACDSDAAACACQGKAVKAAEKLLVAQRSVYRACKKAKVPTATAAADFVACLTSAMEPASVQSDPKGKIAKAQGKLQETLAGSCVDAGVAIATAFPGRCSGEADAASLTACLAREARCRVCGEVLNAEDTSIDCDDFDDGVDNASCRNFQFRAQQSIDNNVVTCSSVETTATYTQCNDFLVSGIAMPNGVTCTEDWFAGALLQTDVDGFCASLTSRSYSEKFLACDVTQTRWGWLDYLWTAAPSDDNGYMKHLRCHY